VIRLGALLLVACLLSGCAGDDPTYEGGSGQLQGPAPTGPSATATGTATGTATLPPSEGTATETDQALADLAAAAQSQAGTLASQGPLAPRTAPVIGADISWPQCPPGLGIPHKISSGQPMPRDDAEYVVIGLTNGPGFHANPCLADQVTYAKERGLLTAAYAVASYPDDATVKAYGREGPYPADTPGAALLNTGYLQARFNVASMHEVGLESPIVWIDVESVPFYEWSTDPASNALVVTGAAKGYADSGLTVGVYSTPHLWASVVGGLTLDGVPEWRAAGQTSMVEALSRCGPDWSIQGGPAVLGQWVEESRDRNITCPGVEADLGAYFAAPPAG
jgi:hypothetical protein